MQIDLTINDSTFSYPLKHLSYLGTDSIYGSRRAPCIQLRFSESTSMRSALSTTVKPSPEESTPRFCQVRFYRGRSGRPYAEWRRSVLDALSCIEHEAGVSSTLLVKGLEFDHVVITPDACTNRHHWYVALTRATRSVKVISQTHRFEF
ncbi:hypothetical protein V4C53_23375 [Paraburkholderia azotifigens]|uniref:hypothetical protein n=1 Tax=Paraburkholderia azotifigens TaxID=2057004 RepID=UPI00317380F3